MLGVIGGPWMVRWVVADDQPPAKSFAADYVADIKPLLRDKCFSCHGSLKQEGGLRLDASSLISKGGESGPAYEAGSAKNSLLWQRVTAEDDHRMPPVDDGARLTAEEVAKLTHWIDRGAVAPDEAIPEHPSKHWAFQPPVAANVPQVSASWIRSDIDRFLAAEQARVGVQAVGETSRAMLLRRASLALTGLPPTTAELETFLGDPSETAFANAVDRLLDSPRYGERWARHFMDIWRYSDPSGYGKEIRDGRQHIWRWRDWIVESLNQDKGYDRMIVEMLAADEVAPDEQASLRATGFLARNWYKFNRNVWLDNIVEHSSKAFLGLTVNCARCHAHKYDPFEQLGYYRMRAIFETHDVRDDPLLPNSLPNSAAANGMLVRAYDAHLDRETFSFLMGDENRPEKDKPLSPGLPEILGELSVQPVPLPVTVWYPSLREENRERAQTAAQADVENAAAALVKARAAVTAAETKLAEFQEPMPGNSKPPETKSAPDMGRTILSDDFAKLSLDQWTVEAGEWSAQDGRVIQGNGATQQHRLVSRANHPRDFRAKLRLRITGGEQYQSVGFGFDVQDRAMHAVYLSVAGAKVQFTHQGSDARWHYPTEAMAQHPVQVGQDYVLEVVVKDQLLNVLVDGELKVAYALPKRKAGRFSIWAFSATAAFDQLDITALPPETELKPAMTGAAKPPKALSRQDLEWALRVAEAAEQVAVTQQDAAQATLVSLRARTTAELVKYELADGDAEALSKAAGRASRQQTLAQLSAQMAQAKLKIAQSHQKETNAVESVRKKAVAELKAAEKELGELGKKHAVAKQELDQISTQYAALGPQYPKTSSGRRSAFAKWITDRQNPLAARVLVNHVWLRHFDRALVERIFDFGLRSEKPRHAALLDWLAVKFMEDGWSLKALHKRILLSGVYRLSSSPHEASLAIDKDNRTWWRMNPRRMEAEVVRDSVLALGDSLDLTMGGPPIEHTQGQKVLRRSLYFRQDKERQMTFLSLFDGAKVGECYERKATVAPQQALALFNSQLAAEQSQRIAARYAEQSSDDFIQSLFQHVLCRAPTGEEQTECLRFLAKFQDNAASRQQLALVLLNHNDFVTIR